MYTTGASGYVYALDARTGKELWQYQHRVKSTHVNMNATANRGVAKLGERLFLVTADAGVSALDAKTGRLLWHTVMADPEQGYFGSMAPLALKDKIIAGVSGGEFGARGFIDAFDPITGKRLWRFNTIPGPGEFGNDTWSGDSWKRGGGAIWMTGTYDPELDLLYYGVGNPAPDMNGDVRLGDNLFTCSIVALGSSHRQAPLAFPVYAARHARLGFERNAGACRSNVSRQDAKTVAARRPERVLLRLGPDHWRVSPGQALCAADVGEGSGPEGTPDPDAKLGGQR